VFVRRDSLFFEIFPYSVEYPDKPPTTWTLIANMLWRSMHQIRFGDVVTARRSRKQLSAVGLPSYFNTDGTFPEDEAKLIDEITTNAFWMANYI
jgi:hypothetical protein